MTLEFSHQPDQLLDAQSVQDSNQTLQIKEIKKECLRLLTRREHSRREIEAKLTLKGFEPAAIKSAITELNHKGWQDDQRFAESYARSRAHKGFGPLRIAYELKQQGVSSDIINAIVSNDVEWQTLLTQAYHKKYPNSTNVDVFERTKRIRFLQQRGFPNDMITALMKELTQ